MTIYKRTWYTVAFFVVLLSITVSFFRISTYWLSNQKSIIEEKLSLILKTPVQVSKLSVGWYGFEPVVALQKVTIGASDKTPEVIAVDKLSVGINLWKSLKHWRWQPDLLLLKGSQFNLVKNKNKPWQVQALSSQKLMSPSPETHHGQLIKNLLAWLIAHEEVIFRDIHFALDYHGSKSELSLKDLKLIHHQGKLRLKGLAIVNNDPFRGISFVLKLRGNSLQKLNGRAYLSLMKMPLKQFSPVVESAAVRIDKGELNLRTWWELANGQVTRVHGLIDLQSLAFHHGKTGQKHELKGLKANVAYEKSNTGYEIKADRIALLSPIKNDKNKILIKKDKSLLLFQVAQLDMETLKQGLAFLPTALIDKTMLSRHVSNGQLSNVQLALNKKKFHHFFTHFKHITVTKSPSQYLNNLTGELYLDRKAGYFKLDSQNVNITMKPRVKKSLFLSELDVITRWQKINQFYKVAFDKLYLKSDHLSLASEAVLDYKSRIDKSFLSLKGSYTGKHIEQLKPYLNALGLKPKLKKWLNQALVSIPHLSGTVFIKGRLKDFPFDKYKQGEFKCQADIQNAILKYHRLWPSAHKLDAHIEVNKREFRATVLKAKLLKNAVKDILVEIRPLGGPKTVLRLIGNTHSVAAEVARYIKQTPLIKPLTILKEMKYAGHINLDLKLTIPLYPKNSHNLVSGKIKFNNSGVTLPKRWHIRLDNISGTLPFNERGILKSKLKAKLKGYPVSINMNQRLIGPKKKLLAIHAEGHISVSKLKELYNLPILNYMHGLLSYGLELKTFKDSERVNLVLSSQLDNIGVNLPAPFNKSLLSTVPFSLNANIDKKGQTFSFHYSDDIKGRLHYIDKHGRSQLKRGDIIFGRGEFQAETAEGLQLKGRLARLNLSDWYYLISKNKQSNNQFSLLKALNHVAVTVGEFKINHYVFKDLSVNLLKHQHFWQCHLNSPSILGDIRIPKDNKQVIQADFKRLFLPQGVEEPFNTMPKTKLPSVNLTVKDFRYNQMSLGRLKLQTTRKDKQTNIDALTLLSPSYEVNLIGAIANQIKDKSYIKGYFLSQNIRQSLEQWQLEPVIESKRTELNFDLKWPGDGQMQTLDKLEGRLHLKLNHGRITHLSEKAEKQLGLGKVLSILSLQTLPRRLALDFSDLSHKGYSFDVFSGDFNLNKGFLTTRNSTLNGPVATARLTGQINLIKKRLKLFVKISPQITASLPVVATIAGGPVAGIATWVASKIINPGLNQVSAYTYKVEGPWQRPIVQQLKIIQHKKIKVTPLKNM